MQPLTIDQELLDVALEALAKHNVKLGNLDSTTSEIKSEIAKRAKYYKDDRRALDTKLMSLQQDMVSSVQSEMSKIPVPANGKDGKDGYIGKDGIDGKPGDTGPQGKQGLIGPEGKPGIDGKIGPQGLPGINGKDGADGKSITGKPGTGIKKITTIHNKLVIELDNGDMFDVKLPKAKEVPAGVTAMPTEVVVMRNLADTNIDNAINGDVLTYLDGKWISSTNTSHNLKLNVRATEIIPKGRPVNYVGWNAGLNSIEVELADNDVSVAIGVSETDMTKNQLGHVVTNGTLEGIDTSAYAEGSILYVNGAGTFTDVEPTTGFRQPLAFVLRSQQNNGALLVTTDYPKQVASDVGYINTDSGLIATNVKDAIDEIAASAGGIDITLKRRTEIESLFKVAQSTAYKELTYTDGNITNVDIYTDVGKLTKLFSKIIGYNNGNISTITITDEVNGGTLNKTLAYTGLDISSVTSTYTA